MSQIKRLQTIDAGTLQSTAYEPVSFVIDDLLPQGLHLLAGAPKIGKSWLALWLCLCAAQGEPLWAFATRPCEVLYLCLEDSFQRIQSRLFDLTEDAPPTLHFAVMSQQLHNGLVEQIEQFLKEHPRPGSSSSPTSAASRWRRTSSAASSVPISSPTSRGNSSTRTPSPSGCEKSMTPSAFRGSTTCTPCGTTS